MPILASVVVDQARDYHPGFDPRSTPDKAALRALSRYQRRLAQKVTEVNEEALATTLSFSKTLVDAAALAGITGAGLVIPDHILILGAFTKKVLDPSRRFRVDLIPYANLGMEALRRFPSAFLIRQVLHPVNSYESGSMVIKGSASATHGWEDLDGIDLLIVLTPPALTTMASEISLPDTVEDALVTNLALFMARRKPGALRDLPDLKQDALDAELSAISTLGGQDSTSHWSTVVV